MNRCQEVVPGHRTPAHTEAAIPKRFTGKARLMLVGRSHAQVDEAER